MRTKIKILKLLIILCSAFATMAGFGQTTHIWTGAGDGTNLFLASNWSDGIVPNPNNNDTAEWNGVTTSNLFLVDDTAIIDGPGISGLNLYLTANQTNSVSISTTLATSQGLAVYNITIDANAGSLTLGSTSSAHVLYMPQRPSGVVHTYVNNSTNPAIVNPWVWYKAGGGAAYTMDFSGSGNWIVNNYLQPDNSSGGVTVQVDGPGTMTWNPTGYYGSDAINGINITGGTLVLAGPHAKITGRNIIDNGTFQFNAPSQSQTLSGVISGSGVVQVSDGTFTLSGVNTYAGGTTISGGTLQVGASSTSGSVGTGPVADNSVLAFNRSDNVTFTNVISGSGSLVKQGAGTLTLTGANTYSGLTTVSGGKLVIAGSAGSGAIAVADGATLGIMETGTQIAPSTLVSGSSSGATLEFNNVTNTTTAPLAAGTVSAAGPITVNINSGSFADGNHYPLFSWSSGSAPAVQLGTVVGAVGNLSTNGNTITLNITALICTWTGAGDGTNVDTAGNWTPGLPNAANGDEARFDDLTASNLFLINNTANFASGPGQSGLNLHLTANQTNSVNIESTLAFSQGMAVYNVTIDAGAGSLTLGGTNTSRLFYMPQRPSGVIHNYVNNSTNPATISPWVMYMAGGGALYTMAFGGTGNWHVNNYLCNNDNGVNVQVDGPGTTTWNPTGYMGSTPVRSINISGGALVLTAPHSKIKTSSITDNGIFEFNAPSQSQTLAGDISGSGTLEVSNGTLFINGSNSVASTTVNGGTLGGAGAFYGPVTLNVGAALAPGAAAGSVGTLTLSNNLTIAGDIAIEVNKSLAPSNDFVVVGGVLTNTGTGTLTVANLGPALVVGDKFTLFSQAVSNGAALAVTGAGATWTNNLAVDGSITVTSASRPTLNFTQTGNSLQFSWNTSFGNYKLQSQTNSLDAGLGSNWVDYPGGGTSPVTVPVNATNGSVFFRLVSTP